MAAGEIAVARRAGRPFSIGRAVPGVGAGIAVGATGLANGGYFPAEWGWAALGFALAALVALLVRERVSLGRLEWAAAAALAAFAAWTLLSVLWSPSSAQPVLAFERTCVYVLALLAAFFVATSRMDAEALVAGALAGTFGVSGYALATKVAPGSLASFAPDGHLQLPGPIGYSNGLGILAAIGILAAVGLAANARSTLVRVPAVAALPVLVATLYLTFSRGSWLALAVGLGVALVVDPRRLHLVAVSLLAALAPAVVVWRASAIAALTHEQPTLAAARAAGHRLGAVTFACTVAAVLVGLALPTLERRVRVGARASRGVAAAAVIAGLAAVVAALLAAGGPTTVASSAAHSFSHPLPDTGGDLNRRLTSLSSDGRSDYWRVASQEVRAHPLLGGSGGSFVSYWHRLRPTGYEARNAHNLYLETLAELGPVGLALLVAVFALPLLAVRRARGGPATTAGAAAFAAFAFHAAVDWDFQLVAVSLAALACGAAVLVGARDERAATLLPAGGRVALSAVVAVAAVAAVVAQVGNSALSQGQAAFARGDSAAAASRARRAARWQPWSYEPLQLLGEAQLATGRPASARSSLRHALTLDPTNADLWRELADASAGRTRTRALAEARLLDPLG